MSAATPRVNIDRGTRIKSACSLPHSAHHPPYLSPPSFSPSTFPPPLRLSLARSLPLNLRYLSLSGIHYRFYWGQSRQTDRPTDRPRRTATAAATKRTTRRSRWRSVGRPESEWIMPRRYSIPCRRRRRVAPLCRPFLPGSSAPLPPDSPLRDGSRPDL